MECDDRVVCSWCALRHVDIGVLVAHPDRREPNEDE